eukprot:gene12147-14353_t
MANASDSTDLKPPVATKRAHRVPFGAVEGENRGYKPFKQLRYRDDPWFWLRDDERKNEEVLELLRRENAYTTQQTAHLEKFKSKLYDEHISHLKQTDDRPAYRHGKFYYYSKTIEGKSYDIYCRKKASTLQAMSNESEEITLDVNLVAEGHTQCVVSGVQPSPDHALIAYSVDFSGNETYDVRVRTLATGEDQATEVVGVVGGVVWGADNSEFYYLAEDEAKRPYKLFRHRLGELQSQDECLFTEPDDLFYMDIWQSQDGKFLLVESSSTETTEIAFLDLLGGTALTTIQPREFGLRYGVDHHDGLFIIWTNIDSALNNRLMTAPVAAPGKANWQEVIPYDPARKIDSVQVFKGFLALEGREAGLTQLWTIEMGRQGPSASTLHKVAFDEDLYEASISINK